jgi:ParB family chromosome partitioning protein
MAKVIDGGLSVRATERMVAQIVRPDGGSRRAAGAALLQRVSDRLTRQLGAKVKVERRARSKKGRIVIEYGSQDELDRLVATLTPG